jgi:hypothetical protein
LRDDVGRSRRKDHVTATSAINALTRDGMRYDRSLSFASPPSRMGQSKIAADSTSGRTSGDVRADGTPGQHTRKPRGRRMVAEAASGGFGVEVDRQARLSKLEKVKGLEFGRRSARGGAQDVLELGTVALAQRFTRRLSLSGGNLRWVTAVLRSPVDMGFPGQAVLSAGRAYVNHLRAGCPSQNVRIAFLRALGCGAHQRLISRVHGFHRKFIRRLYSRDSCAR